MRRWAPRAVLLLLSCASCGGEVGPDAGLDATGLDVGEALLDTGAAPGPDTFDPSCHYDCFFGLTCIEGVVYEQDHAPVPCAAWTGMCPRRERGRCTEGCSDRIPSNPLRSADWRLWCEETEGRRVGDPCTTDEDCQVPEGYEPGGRNYLACDGASATCVAIEAPVAPTTRCSASFDGISAGAYGVVEDASCESGWCQFSLPLCDGCVLPCTDDWDCPPELRCEEMADWTDRGTVVRRNVCADHTPECG